MPGCDLLGFNQEDSLHPHSLCGWTDARLKRRAGLQLWAGDKKQGSGERPLLGPVTVCPSCRWPHLTPQTAPSSRSAQEEKLPEHLPRCLCQPQVRASPHRGVTERHLVFLRPARVCPRPPICHPLVSRVTWTRVLVKFQPMVQRQRRGREGPAGAALVQTPG